LNTRKHRWDEGFRVRVLGLLVLLTSLLVGLGIALTRTYSHVTALQQQVEKTRQNVLLMEQAAGTYSEMTSALRGYLLTGSEPFLEPYISAQARIDLILDQLRAKTDGDQANRVEQVALLVRDWQEEVAKPAIAARQANSPQAALLAVGSGEAYSDEIRKAKDEFIRTESDRLNQEMNSVAQAARLVRIITWAGVGIAGFLAYLGFFVLASSFTRSVGALSSAAAAIAAGKRGVVIDRIPDGELQEVADAFMAMSQTLANQEEELQKQREQLIAQNEELLAQQEELQAHAAELERRDMRLSRLNRIGQALLGTIDLDQLSYLILDEYLDLFGGQAGLLLVADNNSEEMIVQAERWASPEWLGRRVRPTGPLDRSVSKGELVVADIPDTVTQISLWSSEVQVQREVYIPLVHTARTIAVAVVALPPGREIPDEAHSLWNGIAREAAMALAAAMNHLEVKRALVALQEQAAQVEELNAQLQEERDRAAAQRDIYLSIVSTMRPGAWFTDPEGRLLVVNDPFREFFGDVPKSATLDQVLATMEQRLPPGSPFLQQVRDLFASRNGVAEGTIELTNGYTLQWSSAPVGKGDEVMGRLFTFQDVTELAKLDRLKSEFVSAVSHELRTPLTSIIGYLSLVLNEQVGPLQPQQKEFLSVVKRNTDRLANLINDILDIQRIESGRMPLKYRPVQLSEVVRQVAETFRVAAEQKGLTFEVDAPETGIPLVSGDPDRMTQITSNLVSNAVKYTPKGWVKVSVYYDEKQNRVCLAVEDTGIGIPPAEQKRIFEKFYRGTHPYAREAGGTGLGLSLVKMMVEEQGGEVTLESEPDKGSRFTVSFPPYSETGTTQ